MNKKEIKKAECLYKKSIRLLCSLQLPNGGILASPHGKRYPYAYSRDHSICLLALLEAGLLERARKGLFFILQTQKKDGSFPQRVTAERKDASYKPEQLDNTALVVYSFAKYIKKSKDVVFAKKESKKIKKALYYIKKQFMPKEKLFFTLNSIHEFPPYEAGLEVWANSICYAALREACPKERKTRKYLIAVRKGLDRLWDPVLSCFVKTIRLKEASSVEERVDASAYSLADFGILSDQNNRIKKTVKTIYRKLWYPKLGGICRYEKDVGRNNGGYGPWSHFTLMLARHFIRLGEKEKADNFLKWVLGISYHNLLPEHIATKREFEEWLAEYKTAGLLRPDRKRLIRNIRGSPLFKRGLAYSVLPLAWPHAEFIRTWLLYKKRFKK